MVVKLYTQTSTMDCWFASAMMVLRYFKKTDKEYSQLKKEYGTQRVTDPETGDGEVELGTLMDSVGGNEYIIMNLLGTENIETELIYRESSRDFNDIVKREIAAGRPVILGLDRGAGGHFVVAYSMDGDELLIMDPNPSANHTHNTMGFDEVASAVIVTKVN